MKLEEEGIRFAGLRMRREYEKRHLNRKTK